MNHEVAITRPGRRLRGTTLLESLLLLTLTVTLMMLVAAALQQHVSQQDNWQTAAQFKKVSKAASCYLLDHWESLTNPKRFPKDTCLLDIDVEDDLVARGYLSPTDAAVNSYQQTHQVQLVKPKQKKGTPSAMPEEEWQLCITTQGGTAIPAPAWRQIGRHLDTLMGSPLQTGHLATCQPLAAPKTTPIDTFLHRKKVTGWPILNQMHTPLQLAEHAIQLRSDAGSFSLGINHQRWLFKNQGDDRLLVGSDKPNGEKFSVVLRDKKSGDRCIIRPTELAMKVGPSTSDRLPRHGPQLHGAWNRLPLLALPEKVTTDEMQEHANKQCREDMDMESRSILNSMGRLFVLIPAGEQQGTAFICGKRAKNKSFTIHAYPLVPLKVMPASQPLTNTNSSEFYKPLVGSRIIGILFSKVDNKEEYKEVQSFLKIITEKIFLFMMIEHCYLNNNKEKSTIVSYCLDHFKNISRGSSHKAEIPQKDTIVSAITDYLTYIERTHFNVFETRNSTIHWTTIESIYKDIVLDLHSKDHYQNDHKDHNRYIELIKNKSPENSSKRYEFYSKLFCFEKFSDYNLRDIIKDIIVINVKNQFSKSKLIKLRYQPDSIIGLNFSVNLADDNQAAWLLLFFRKIGDHNKDKMFQKHLNNLDGKALIEFSASEFKTYYNKKRGEPNSQLNNLLKDLDNFRYEMPADTTLEEDAAQDNCPFRLRKSDAAGVEIKDVMPPPPVIYLPEGADRQDAIEHERCGDNTPNHRVDDDPDSVMPEEPPKVSVGYGDQKARQAEVSSAIPEAAKIALPPAVQPTEEADCQDLIEQEEQSSNPPGEEAASERAVENSPSPAGSEDEDYYSSEECEDEDYYSSEECEDEDYYSFDECEDEDYYSFDECEARDEDNEREE